MNGFPPYHGLNGFPAYQHLHGFPAYQQLNGFPPQQQADPPAADAADRALPRMMRLREAERQQEEMLQELMAHRQRQLTFIQRQAAAAAQATLALPEDTAQVLQQDSFERSWQQLEASWRQARAMEQAVWVQLRRQQVGAGR